MVSRPVAVRSMIQGATTAPRMPQSPAAVSTSPIWSAGKPPSISRSTATKNRALTARLVSAPHTVSTRKNGRDAMNRMPSARSCAGRRGEVVVGAERSVRTRPSSSHDTAKLTASAANGSHRVTAYSTPPSGAPSRPATWRRAWFWLIAVGSSSSVTTVRTADDLGRGEEPGGGAGQQRDDRAGGGR